MEHLKNQIITRAICLDCKNFINDGEWTCKAFPEGIPDEIVFGDNDHVKPLKSQGNDIVFEPNN